MKRRTVLGLVVTGSVGGCLGTGGGPPPEEVVAFDELPSEAQTEFETVLREGGLHKCDVALLDVEESYVEYEGDYYSVVVQQGDGNEDEPCNDYFVQVESVDLSS
ncbi:hypothetical protein [Haloferax sp. YSSS75]|uniref:hypothetical protein n=1 Tax=Haloferax sp. YSSS75 TaxID=3388564 RepID=UPI00398CDCF9